MDTPHEKIIEKPEYSVMPPEMVLWPNCTCLVKTLSFKGAQY
jgi:hypothetical protein